MKKIVKILNTNIFLGNYYNIPFKLHWTIIPFFILIPLLGFYYNKSTLESVLLLLLVICILFSVLFHELGHAAAARTEGIQTHDILISLIGGAARLEQMPEEPNKEIKIAFAGPLVNLLIFFVTSIPLVILMLFGNYKLDLSYSDLTKPVVFLSLVAVSNLLLFLFNLVPAFPMDGGRIFRAFLAKKMSREKATKFASIIGKALAIIMIIFGIVSFKPIYALIGIFIFLLAEIEHNQEKNNIRFRRIKALDICDKEYHIVKMSTPMNELIKQHFDKDVSLFIVMGNDKKVKGIVDKFRLEDAMREKNSDFTVSYYLSHRYAILNVSNDLLEIYDEMIVKDLPLALVMDYGELIGTIDTNILMKNMRGLK